MEEKDSRLNDPIRILGGTALRVYLLLLRSRKPLGVREVQRLVGLRSPSTARHHLERLVSLGLAERRPDGYVAVRPRGLLSLYIAVQGRLLPRTIGLAAFAAAAAAVYAFMPGADPAAASLLAVIAAIVTWHAVDEYRAVKTLLEENDRR